MAFEVLLWSENGTLWSLTGWSNGLAGVKSRFNRAFYFLYLPIMHRARNGFRTQVVVVGVLIAAGLLLVGGCTTFNHDWTRAAKEPVSNNSLVGLWEGTWLSDVNGHNGSLRCVVTRKDDGTYQARFHAIYRKVLGFGYTVPLQAIETNGVFQFSGQANLGWWAGGVYHYEGQAHGTNFFSTYRCKYDHGTFQMNRPVQTNVPAKPQNQARNQKENIPAT